MQVLSNTGSTGSQLEWQSTHDSSPRVLYWYSEDGVPCIPTKCPRLCSNTKNQKSSDPCEMESSCLFCTEDFSLTAGSPHRAIGVPCCGKQICQNCLYRHILSVIEEGVTGQGRTKLSCPMGCGIELTDKTVRTTIDREHPSSFGWILWIWMLGWVGYFNSSADQWYRRHSRLARNDLDKYNTWSLTLALRTIDGVQCCPAPDCGYQWITNPKYRKHKIIQEQQIAFLWFSPPKPEVVPYQWVEPEYLNINSRLIERNTTDGRRMVCPNCQAMFCGLCRHPWDLSPIKSHSHRSCVTFSRKYSRYLHDDYSGQPCRSCPGCTLRTIRTEGCNHMTCPCGTQWCYECEGLWTSSHYYCQRATTQHSEASLCTIM